MKVLIASLLLTLTLSTTLAAPPLPLPGGNLIAGDGNALIYSQNNKIFGNVNTVLNADSNVVVGGGNALLNTGSNLVLGHNNLVSGGPFPYIPYQPDNNCKDNNAKPLPAKIAIRAFVNGKFVSAQNAGKNSLIANRDKISP